MANEQELLNRLDRLTNLMERNMSGNSLRSGYSRSYSNIDDLNDELEDIKKQEEEINELIKEAIKNGKSREDYAKKLNDLKKEQLKLEKQISEEEKNQPKALGKIANGVEKVTRALKETYRAVQSLNDPWAKADEAASKYIKTLGGTKKAMEELRQTTINNVVKSHIGIEFDMSPEELMEAQMNYVKAIGKNLRIDTEAQIDLAALKKLGVEGLANDFEQFGLGIQDTGKHATAMWKEASEAGLSFEKYSDNVAKNIKIAQNYTFKNGLRGLESMAKKATAMKMDMQAVAALADKVSTVEGSIDVASKLQVLGGPFAAMADPMGMLNEGLTDMEGLQDRITKMIGGLGRFDKTTGEVAVSAFDKQRIRAAANAMGMNYDTLMESVNRQAARGEIEAQLNSTALDEKMRELVKNSATFKNGKAGVSINGEWKELSELQNGDYKQLLQETQNESANIRQIAIDLRSLVEMRSGARKQYNATQAKATKWTAQGEKWATGLGQSNLFLSILLGLNAVSTMASLFRFGRRGGGFGRLGKKATSKIAGSTIEREIGKTVAKETGEAVAKVTGEATIKGTSEAAAKSLAQASKGQIMKYGLGSAGKRTSLKLLGKTGTKVLGGIAKGGGIGIVGAAGDIATDILVDKGKIEKGGKAHAAMKGVSSALEWGGLGLAALGATGVGLPLAIALGTVMGGRAIAKVRRGKQLDEALAAKGLERNGEYSPERLKKINQALVDGKMSKSLRNKLIREGDMDLVNEIEGIKSAKDVAKEEKRLNRIKARHSGMGKIEVGYFEVGVANFGGVKGIPENGRGGNWSPLNRRRGRGVNDNEIGPQDINVNLNGTIKLEGANGQKDITKDLLNDKQFVRKITDIIIKQINHNSTGNYIEGQRPVL